MKYLKQLSVLILLGLAIVYTSCDNSDEVIPEEPPRAIFNFNVTDNNKLTFSNFSVGGASYLWDFGDGSSSTDENPVHIYTIDGTYTIKLKVINTGGSTEITKSITIDSNLIEAGDMNTPSAWTFKQIWNDPNNQVISSFSNGKFLWDAAPQTNYAQTSLWQEISIQAGKKYKFSADIASTSGTESIWFELYFGKVDPATVGDYNSNGKRLDINSSGCANNPFNGNFVTIARQCDDRGAKILAADGTFTLSVDELTSKGTVYVVIKSGAWNTFQNYKDGITLDNVSIKEVP
jgi:PKD repeat protein